MRSLACIPLALLLGACSMNLSPGRGFGERNYFSRVPTAPVELVPVSRSGAAPQPSLAVLALHEGAGRVLKLREKHFINGSRQEIVLDAGPGVYGENVIDVSMLTSGTKAPGAKNLEIGPPSESGIRNEILGRFPDVRMNIVTRPMRNRFGPFGLAIGRHPNGARCIFVWQWVDDLREQTPGVSNFVKFSALMGNRALTTSIRMRLCRMGVTVDQLAGYAEAMHVPARSTVERLASMDRRNFGEPEISQNGIQRSPLLKPVGASLEAALGGKGSSGATTPVRRAARRASAPEAAPVPRPRPRRVARPAPVGNYNAIKHYTPGGAPVSAAATAAPPGRYLAPVMDAPTASAAPVANYRRSRGVSLPPEAYRGPQQN